MATINRGENLKPHVLFLSYHFPTPEEPGAFRPWMEAHLLAKAGFDVTVVTSGVQYMTGEDIRTGCGWCTEELRDGIRILRTWAPTEYRGTILKRIFNYLSYTILAGWASLTKVSKVTRIFAGTDPIFVMPMVFLVSKIKRVPMVLDERDLYPETAIALGVMRDGWLSRLLFSMQQFYRRSSSSILAATPGIKAKLIVYGCPAEKVKLLYNADTFLDEGLNRANTRSLSNETGRRFLVGYVGGLGQSNDIMTLLRAAHHLLDIEDMAIVIIGSGEMRHAYADYCRMNKLVNVFFLGVVPRNEARNLLQQMDVCVKLLPPDQHFSYTLQSKAFDYHGLGIPMVFCGHGDTVKLLESSGGGLAVASGDDRALADAIRQLKDDEFLRQRMGTSARNWFEQHIRVDKACSIFKKAMNVR